MSNPNDKKILNAILNPNTPFEEEEKPEEHKTKYEESKEINDAKELEAKESAGILLEQLNELHRKQRKELQAKTQSLKKSVTKGDKKRKKEIDAEIEKLEKEFEEKCQLELKNFNESAAVEAKKVENAKTTDDSDPVGSFKMTEISNKLSKAQKRREKKEKSEAERELEIARQAIENDKGPAAVELRKIKEKLKSKGLMMKDVKSDGNCMYYAVSDQLDHKMYISKTCEQLREACCQYMLSHTDEFLPYLTLDESDGEDSLDKYREYCERIRDVANWGGHVELKALSDALGVCIEVVQADGSELVIGNSDPSKQLVITYHRHMYGAGEHYNSTQPIKETDENQTNN